MISVNLARVSTSLGSLVMNVALDAIRDKFRMRFKTAMRTASCSCPGPSGVGRLRLMAEMEVSSSIWRIMSDLDQIRGLYDRGPLSFSSSLSNALSSIKSIRDSRSSGHLSIWKPPLLIGKVESIVNVVNAYETSLPRPDRNDMTTFSKSIIPISREAILETNTPYAYNNHLGHSPSSS